jgi:hypothetical protein
MFGEGLRRVAPFVTLRSFVLDAYNGRYYFQDPNTASELLQEFRVMKDQTDGWKNVAREKKIKWVILRTSDPTEMKVFKEYTNDAILRRQNRDWAVLELSL